MSLQRRLWLYLLICAPLVWGVALLVTAQRARHEVNELFDTELMRLARQLQSTLPGRAAPEAPATEPATAGAADLRDLAVAVWDARGRLQHRKACSGGQARKPTDCARFPSAQEFRHDTVHKFAPAHVLAANTA